jgi:hypothetical protein
LSGPHSIEASTSGGGYLLKKVPDVFIRFITILPKLTKWSLLIAWTFLFLGGITHYQGSPGTYAVFSIVFFAMLLSGFYRQISYGYLFLVVMLWLGFWLKMTIYLLLRYPFEEPLGFFVGTPASWDEVLRIASIGAAGVLLGRFLYGLLNTHSSMIVLPARIQAPAWYPAIRKRVWAVLMFVCLGTALINLQLGIEQIGIGERTVLIWPLNTVVYWLISSGFVLGISTLLWWDIALGQNISLIVYFILLESFAASISLFSRGVTVFHTIPQYIALFKNRHVVQGWSWKNSLSFAGIFFALLLMSYAYVNKLRSHYYSETPLTSPSSYPKLVSTTSADMETKEILVLSRLSQEFYDLPRFALYRWVGLEGVMAVSAYPKKGYDLFIRDLKERGGVGKTSIYQEVSQSSYRFMDSKKFQFASLPGAMGFLYLTGSLCVVGLGMFAFSSIVIGSERLVSILTCNPLLSALWGIAVSNSVVQMGIVPRGLITYFLEMCFGIAAIWFIQSKYCSMIYERFKSLGQ